MRATLILFVFALFIFNEAKSQNDFIKAYIINNTNDTLQGQIYYTGDLNLTLNCKFKPNNSDNLIAYQPGDIKGFYMDKNKFFVSREVNLDNNTKHFFLEMLIKGEICILKLNTALKTRYFIESLKDGLTEIPYNENLIYENDKIYLSSSKKHYGILTHYTTKVPNLSRIIHNIHEPTEKKLINLIENYHRLLHPNKEHTTFGRKKAEIDAYIELNGGVPLYNSSLKTSLNYPLYGSLIHVSTSNLNKKLYLKTGFILYHSNNYNTDIGNNKYKLKIPVQVEYLPRKGRIKPRLAYGFNFYEPLPNITAFNVGMITKIYRSVYFTVNTETEFNNRLLIIPKKLFSFNTTAGISFKIK